MSEPEETKKEEEATPEPEPEPVAADSESEASVPPKKPTSWEKELVKKLEVTWGDAKAILQIAKDELGIDQKDYPEESKAEVFAKCEEVAESFEKTPRVSLSAHPRDSRKGASTKEPEPEPEPETWEQEIKAEYKCTLVDATTLLQMAKHELEIDEKDYPEDQKEALFAKVKELSEGFDFAPVPQPATIVFVRDPWADELSNELNCRITNAKQLLLLAKRDLGLPEDKPAPESRKGEIFEKARQIAVTYDLTPKDKGPEETDNKLALAIVIAIIVVALIVGISVGVSRRNRSEDPTEATDAPTGATTSEPGPSLPTDCVQEEKGFSVAGLAVAMAVSSDISEVEINYAARVFQRTYVALLTGVVEDLTDYCDPFCRTISDVQVISSEVVPAEDSSFVDEGCDSELDLIFGVNGTFVGCPETEFPGLFAVPSRRQLSALADDAAFETASFLRGGSVRWLQDADQLCSSCPDDSSSLGNVVPTEEEMIEVIDPLLSVLPSICAVSDIVVLEEEGEVEEEIPEIEANATAVEGQGPPEGGWTDIDCAVTLSSDNCASFLELDTGIIPCGCDGQCIQYVNGAFVGCNDSGEVEGVTGEVTISASGCTFAQHAADLVGFTCSP